MEDFVKLDTVEQYYKLFGMVGPTHPLVGVRAS